jgi:serine/threonine protein kinase
MSTMNQSEDHERIPISVPASNSVGLPRQESLSTVATANGKREEFIEKSPAGHYVKFNEILGKGAFKTVYRAQDLEHGNLVAWNEVNIKAYGPKERKRILNEVTLLRTLTHPSLISFYGAWVNKEAEKVVFITELMSSGTMKDFCYKYPISLRQIKKYARDILECINYLHTPSDGTSINNESNESNEPTPGTANNDPDGQNASSNSGQKKKGKPVVIHRDLKCDNIFIQGKHIKIGDLGLATTDGRSILGTPEFMAPEMYETGYSTSVDIYAFGMCVLEMVTAKTPFIECGGVVAIYKRVLAGILPENLRVLEEGWPECFAFVMRCLTPKAVVVNSPSGVTPSSDSSLPLGGLKSSMSVNQTNLSANSRPSATQQHDVSDLEHDDDHVYSDTAPGALSRQPPTPLQISKSVSISSTGERRSVASTSSNVSGSNPSTIYVRPSAFELLQDPFLIVTEDDAGRNTEDVRNTAASKGMFVITGPDDVHRRLDLPPLKIPTADLASSIFSPSMQNTPSLNGSVAVSTSTAVMAEVPSEVENERHSSSSIPSSSQNNDKEVVAENLPIAPQSSEDHESSGDPVPSNPPSASPTDSAVPFVIQGPSSRPNRSLSPVIDGKTIHPSSSSRSFGSSVDISTPVQFSSTPPSGVSLATVYEDVRVLRHEVHALYVMLEWLITKADGGKAWLDERREKVKAHRAHKAPSSSALHQPSGQTLPPSVASGQNLGGIGSGGIPGARRKVVSFAGPATSNAAPSLEFSHSKQVQTVKPPLVKTSFSSSSVGAGSRGTHSQVDGYGTDDEGDAPITGASLRKNSGSLPSQEMSGMNNSLISSNISQKEPLATARSLVESSQIDPIESLLVEVGAVGQLSSASENQFEWPQSSIFSSLLPRDVFEIAFSTSSQVGDESNGDHSLERICLKLKSDARREVLRLAKMASKQLSEISENRKKESEEFAEAMSVETLRHDREMEKIEKSRAEINKVLIPLRKKLMEAGDDDDDSAVDDVEDEENARTSTPSVKKSSEQPHHRLSIREREQMLGYERKEELLHAREVDEASQHSSTISKLQENHEAAIKRYLNREKNAKDGFVSKYEKAITDLQEAFISAVRSNPEKSMEESDVLGSGNEP